VHHHITVTCTQFSETDKWHQKSCLNLSRVEFSLWEALQQKLYRQKTTT